MVVVVIVVVVVWWMVLVVVVEVEEVVVLLVSPQIVNVSIIILISQPCSRFLHPSMTTRPIAPR